MSGRPTIIAAFFLGCISILYVGRRILGSRTSHPLPPGPPRLPWIGNIFGIDTDAPWKTYSEWAKTYGDIVYSQLLGKDIIIINSEKIAKDLLEKRSKNYSDRPYLVTVEMSGVDKVSIPLRYPTDAVARFLPSQHRRACRLLRQLLASPEELGDHIFEYTASIILNVVYNYDPPSRKDELLDIMANVLDIISPALRPDIAVVTGAFPFLLWLPSWFPGMSFKKDMENARAFSKHYLERPFEHSIQNMPSVSPAPSMLSDALCNMNDQGITPEEAWVKALRDACGSAFLAASETSTSVLLTFFLMMLMNPTVQERAHTQIYAVVGRERLPTLKDRPLLPLVDAIIRETIRNIPVTPLSLPHATVNDDVYCGFRIPKGAMVIANLWSMAHDETRYRNPHAFIPERFLSEDGSLKANDVENIAFGFGRRICPGRHFADISVWNVVAKVLAIFKILKPLDKNGAEIPVEAKFSTGLAVHPLPFKCRIVPRFPGMDAETLEEIIAATII